jgi:sulfur-oxidizing protein SoxY
MNTDIKRRVFLKGSLAAGSLGVAVGAGLLTPQTVLAEWNKEAFGAKDADTAVKGILGDSATEESGDIKINAPEIAENGAVVPVKVDTTLKAESITILASNNPVPLVCSFTLGEGAKGYASTRIKMGKTGDVVAIVKADGKLYSAKKSVKVTIGGCGG